MQDQYDAQDADTLVQMVRASLRYEPETGKLFWLDRPDIRPSARARLAGKEAFIHVNHNGYKNGAVFGRHILAHVAIWILQHGCLPDAEIDHINGIKTDNRAVNLRACSRFENAMNRGVRSDSHSGLKGVSFHAGKKKWFARITHYGVKVFLGYFDSAQSAHNAYCAAATKLHGQFARTA